MEYFIRFLRGSGEFSIQMYDRINGKLIEYYMTSESVEVEERSESSINTDMLRLTIEEAYEFLISRQSNVNGFKEKLPPLEVFKEKIPLAILSV